MVEADLIHFANAQDKVYRQVIEELTNGRKQSHWVRFVFPQLSGLGHSVMAQRYAIRQGRQKANIKCLTRTRKVSTLPARN